VTLLGLALTCKVAVTPLSNFDVTLLGLGSVTMSLGFPFKLGLAGLFRWFIATLLDLSLRRSVSCLSTLWGLDLTSDLGLGGIEDGRV
jgi:hypothetical protein